MDGLFDTALRLYGGEDAVRQSPDPTTSASIISNWNAATSEVTQITWEEYKIQREKARELRREQRGGKFPSLWSWFDKSSNADLKAKKE